jgi:hypothetical protein
VWGFYPGIATFIPFKKAPATAPGWVAEVHGDIDLHLTFFDESHRSVDAGTELPVVREEQFTSERFFLLPEPLLRGYRYLLRVYAFDETQVHVRVFGANMIDPLKKLDRVIALTKLDDVDIVGRPAYAQIDLTPIFNVYEDPERLPIIEITSATSEPVWAFLSQTNNETQQVTVTTPHLR